MKNIIKNIITLNEEQTKFMLSNILSYLTLHFSKNQTKGDDG